MQPRLLGFEIGYRQYLQQKEELRMVDHFQLGEAFFGQGEYVKACEEYEQAIADQQDCWEIYHNWGVALCKTSQVFGCHNS